MIKLQELHIHPSFDMYLLINESVMFLIPLNFSHHYLHDC
jgi:hypothetical protein